MKERMKSYLVFSGFGYKLLVFMIVPVLLILLGTLVSILFDFPGYLLAIYLLPAIEIALDAFVFEGISSKAMIHLEYLKTSKRGITLMKNALQGGMIRILVTNAIILAANYLLYHGRCGDIWNVKRFVTLLWFMVFMYVIIMGMIVIARCFASTQVNCYLGAASIILELFSVILMKNLMASFVALLIVAVMISIFSVKIVEKRIKESYYDKTVTDGV